MAKIKPLKERKQDFIDNMRRVIALKRAQFPQYDNSNFLNTFYGYWTEKGENDKKMRFELRRNQPFDMWRRMVRFFNQFGTEKWQEKMQKKTGVYRRPNQRQESELGPPVDYKKYNQRQEEENQRGGQIKTLGERMKERWNTNR